jgi:tricorn protease
MKCAFRLLALLLCVVTFSAAQSEQPLPLQNPAVSQTQVAFVYGGDLWIVGREGGEARRLTTAPGLETTPYFSPDGSQIAFTGEYDGNVDVYVVAAAGGVPKRITYHPGADTVVGWTPDGKRIVFRSGRHSYSRFQRLFTITAAGELPEELPLPMAHEGSFSPDGKRIAYMPLSPAFRVWRNYRGGQATKIWLASLADSKTEEIPRSNANDWAPMWMGRTVYFVSDRNGIHNIFAYDTENKRVTEVTRHTSDDIRSASGGAAAIVYARAGSIYLLDLRSGESRRLRIRVSGDFPGVRGRFERAARWISNADISPTGARAVFEARGEIHTAPAKKGDIRNLTRSPGVADRDPAWSPDGKWIAYFSDESGEYQLHLREQSGQGEVKKFKIEEKPSFYYRPLWSPDGKKIAFTDKRLSVWVLDTEKGAAIRVDGNTRETPFRVLNPAWSPDSKWLAYTKNLKNHLHAVFVYSLESGKPQQLTDGLSDARNAVFDASGKYLYFTASTDYGPTSGWLDMSSFDRTVTRSVYLAVLRKDLPSPLAPESDEEKVEPEKKPEPAAGEKPPAPAERPAAPGREAAKEKVEVKIDFDGISQRILALPFAARRYTALAPGKVGTLFVSENIPPSGATEPEGPPQGNDTLYKFELTSRRPEVFLERIAAFRVSADGSKILFRRGQNWSIVPTTAPPRPGDGALNLANMEVYVDPPAEWRQMFHEIWRIQRDFFYDPGLHGIDLAATKAKYEKYLAGVVSRDDLNAVFAEMMSNMSVGHHNVGGGDTPEVRRIPGGLLGADYVVENGRYRFRRVYDGENWNPALRAPLTQPGVNVKAGEYLLAVGGRELRATDNLFSFFESTANRQVLLKVGPNPDGTGSREVTVVPVASETALRNLAWIEDNRRKVDQLSAGRVAYVYLPNTAGAGFTNFNRYYFAQVEKQAVVVDERFNGGGTAADYIVDYLNRPLQNWWWTREGDVFSTPLGSIYGPRVMIINEYAGSGGDLLPWLFRSKKLGPLVGKRTWGGLVGIYDYPQLIDGGSVTAPRVAFFNLKGEWDVENFGTPPDIEVEFSPEEVRKGRDPQLERAVQVVLEELKKNPPPQPKRPAFPVYK